MSDKQKPKNPKAENSLGKIKLSMEEYASFDPQFSLSEDELTKLNLAHQGKLKKDFHFHADKEVFEDPDWDGESESNKNVEKTNYSISHDIDYSDPATLRSMNEIKAKDLMMKVADLHKDHHLSKEEFAKLALVIKKHYPEAFAAATKDGVFSVMDANNILATELAKQDEGKGYKPVNITLDEVKSQKIGASVTVTSNSHNKFGIF